MTDPAPLAAQVVASATAKFPGWNIKVERGMWIADWTSGDRRSAHRIVTRTARELLAELHAAGDAEHVR
jgi:hypothetical protein